jgi:hypothetical protein
MTSGGHNRKITAEQRAELLRLHLAGLRFAAEEMAVSLGLNKGYAAKLAQGLGYKPRHKPIPTQHKWIDA